MITNRIIVNNSMFPRIQTQLECYPKNSYVVMPELDVISQINDLKDTAILAYGFPFFQLFKQNVAHIGMRNFSYDDFCAVPVVSFGEGNKLIFGRYPETHLDETTSIMLQHIGNPDTWEFIEPKLNFFMSKNIEIEFEPWPTTKCIGLNEAVKELRENWIPYIGQEGVGIDFESSSFPECSDFILSGVSLASAKRMYSVFIDFRMDDGYQTRYDVRNHKEFMETFHEYVTKNKSALWAFNCSFEIGALYWMYEEKIYIQDAMALCVCDNQKKSLKYDWQYYGLGNSWDDFQDIQRNACIEANKAYPTFEEFDAARKRMVDKYNENGEKIGEWSEPESLGIDIQSLPPDLMLKNYWGDEWLEVDPTILGPYCCYDSYAGLKLAMLLYPAYKYPYDVFLSNKYFQFELTQHKFDINISKRDKARAYFNNIENNYGVWLDYFKAVRVVDIEAKEQKWAWVEQSGINTPIMNWLIDNCSYCITPDPMYFAQEFIKYLYSLPENKASMDALEYQGQFNTHILDGLIGRDYSASLQWMVDDFLTEDAWEPKLDPNGNPVLDDKGNPEYENAGKKECICNPPDQYHETKWNGFKAFCRKRGMFKKLGQQLFTDLVDIPAWTTKFNQNILPAISIAYNNWINAYIKPMWALSIPPEGSYYNIMDLRKIKNDGTPKYPQYEEWMATPIAEEGFGITQEDFNLIKMMPQEEVDKLYYVFNLNDPAILSQNIVDLLPEEVANNVRKTVLDYGKYLEYRKMLKLYNTVKAIPIHKMYENSPDKFESTYEPLVNIFSYTTQAPEWLSSFKSDPEVVKALACIRFYWEYRCKNFTYIVPEYGHGRHKNENGEWVVNEPRTIDYGPKGEEIPCEPGTAFYWDWPEFKQQFEQMWDNGSIQQHQLYKEMMSLNWKTEIWTTDCVGGNLVYNAIIPNIYEDIMTTEMPTDMCERVCKLCCLYDVVSTSRKMNKSYIEHMYTVTGQGLPYSHKWAQMEGLPIKPGHLSFNYDFMSGEDEYVCEEYEPIT